MDTVTRRLFINLGSAAPTEESGRDMPQRESIRRSKLLPSVREDLAPLRMRPPRSQDAAAAQAALWHSSPTPACCPLTRFGGFTFVGITRDQNCAGQPKSRFDSSGNLQDTVIPTRPAPPSHCQSILPEAYQTPDRWVPSTRLFTHLVQPFCDENWGKPWFASFPLACLFFFKKIHFPLYKCACGLQAKLCHRCIRTKHGIKRQPDSDSF